MQNFAPIALFVYNRPEHTRRTLKFLRENKLAEESRLFIFSDGPKNVNDQEKVNEVREIIKTIDGFRSVEVVERKENAGLADSIIQGVTRLVDEYGKVIVFEDDLISSPYTLKYFNDALQRYKTADKVMHVGAYMYPLLSSGLPETFFYRVPGSWGWATWKRAWQHFNPDIDNLLQQFNEKLIYEFTIHDTMNFWKQMQEFKKGKNNSWAIRWYASVFLRNGLTLNPSKSLIQNIGNDGTGVHSGVSEIYDVQVNKAPVSDFPEEIKENEIAFSAIKHFLRNRKGNLMKRLVRFLRQNLSRFQKVS